MTSSTDGPDQGDPAAPVPYLLAVVGKDTLPDPDGLVATWNGGDTDEAAGFARDHGHEVVPLYLRAPGAVAAAPPGDKDATDDLRAVLNALYSDGEREAAAPARARFMRHLATGGAVRLVPPAGHEDEAAVRARVRTAVWDLIGWGVDTMKAPAAVEAVTDAALAAARGPRPVEDEAAVERAARARETEQLATTHDFLERWQEYDNVEHFAHDLDAALAAARGPRTPDPAEGGNCG